MKMNAIQLHLLLLGIAMADLCAFLLSGISFRGEWLDILLSIAPFLSAAFALIAGWRRMSRGRGAYFISFVVLNLLALPVYLFGTICFPMGTLDVLGRYEARNRPGLLMPEAAIILKRYGPFEQLITGTILYDSPTNIQKLKLARRNDSLVIVLPRYQRDDSAVRICVY
jgi:hypothetical protein